MNYQIGNIIEGTVTGIQPYGAFVSLDKETQGLIHVSEIQSGFTKISMKSYRSGKRSVYKSLILTNTAKRSVCPAVHWKRVLFSHPLSVNATLQIRISGSVFVRLEKLYQCG